MKRSQQKAMFAKIAEVRGKHSSYPVFYKKVKSEADARAEVRRWNQWDNPYDRLVLLGTSNKTPQSKPSKYGIYTTSQRYKV